jgi:Skp family chaperone for outer membrane proteins
MTLVLEWLKGNWKTLLAFAVVLFAALWLKNKIDESNIEEVKHQYAEQMAVQQKSHDAQVKELNKINDEALAKQKEIGFQYQKQLEGLQQQFDEKVAELDELKKAKVKELTKQLTDDPEIAVQDIAEKFGLTVVVVPPEPDEAQ